MVWETQCVVGVWWPIRTLLFGKVRVAGHSDRNPNSGDAQVLGTKVRK
jgi:hypothetical protein